MAKYPDFIKSTGYGTGEGLCGWNCRHSFHPYFPGIDTPSYTEEELQNIDPPPVEYNGKKLDYYQQTQKQRSMETAMRKTKREIIAAKAAGDDDMFTAKSVLLRRQREEYDKFSKATGLLTQKERTQVYGFDKSISAKAAWAAKKAQNRLDKSGGSGIIGLKTKNGITITGISAHGYERQDERNVPVEDIKDALTSPLKIKDPVIDDHGRRSQRFIGEKATVNVNPDTGNIPTVWRTGSKTVKKYKKSGD